MLTVCHLLQLTLARASDRLHDDRGQTAAEYVGILVIVGLIIVAITQADIAASVTGALSTALGNILGSG